MPNHGMRKERGGGEESGKWLLTCEPAHVEGCDARRRVDAPSWQQVNQAYIVFTMKIL
jgi:hypothetical protein